jgi:hypothetical protein
MKNVKLYFLVLIIMMLSGNLLKAQTSVYVCSTTGTYGYCYGNNDVSTCAYNNCIAYGGETPYSILYVSSKGYGAIALGTSAYGSQVVGAAAGYQYLEDAKNRAVQECTSRGGQNVYIDATFED